MTGRVMLGRVVLAAVGVVLCLWGAACAEEGAARTLSPYFFVEDGDPSIDRVPLKSTDVSANINGVIADVTVRQIYVNEGQRPINARYVFPASTRAAVHGMTMQIGDRRITARIKEKEAAKQEFEAAKAAGKSASLLSQHRPNVFSMNVANIMPGERVEIELRYTELLVPAEGIYSFVYPTVVGPRYSGRQEESEPENGKWVANPYLKQGDVGKVAFNIGVAISAGMPLQHVACTSHQAHVKFSGNSSAKVMLDPKEDKGGNRDFILQYRLAGNKVMTGLMLFDGGDEKFFLLTVQPPQRVQEADIPPREYIFVVDVSGSMHGYPLDVSKELLRGLIGKLRPTERFNVLLFAGGSQLMSPVSVPATRENIKSALALIGQQGGGGGTELLAALKRAFAIPRDEAFSRTVLLVTDGYVSAEKEVFSAIRKDLNRTNVFAFGIGSSVNRHLIEGVAKAGLGEPFIVTKQAEAPEAAKRFADYVKAPVLKDIKVKFAGFDAVDVEPGAYPDLFADRPLVVVGKWRGKAAGAITVTGTSGHGAYSETFWPGKATVPASNSALRYLWARERIARLSEFNFSEENEDNRAEVVALGLRYNLLTRYTSFIAVDEVVRNKEGQAADVKQPLPLPQGVSSAAVGAGARVPEPELALLAVLAAVMLLATRLRSRGFARAKR